MKISFEKLDTVKDTIRVFPRFLAERAFLFILSLIALAVVLALLMLLFARSSLSQSSSSPQSADFKKELFEDAFSSLENRKAEFAKPNPPAGGQNIPNIF